MAILFARLNLDAVDRVGKDEVGRGLELAGHTRCEAKVPAGVNIGSSR